MSKLTYRPDIDGLRAVAVLAVLFYHAGIEAFSGGYVGVDVFFVISGYLITARILGEIQAGRFSFRSFYELRIRRILPALFTVVAVTLLIGSWLYAPEEFAGLGESTIATSLSLANLLFWSQAGYFDTPSTFKPLLHTWSLSIEEQFYLFLPLLMVLAARLLRSKYLLFLSALAGVSFALSLYVVSRDPSAAFYLAHLRAWEFLLGGMLLFAWKGLRPWHRQAFTLAGLGMVLVAILAYSHETRFPGASALLPVVGAALVISGGESGAPLVSRLLGTGPLVLVGKISYSLYLWHWPFLVFLKYYLVRALAPGEILLWLAATFVVSYLSWKFVETPFRVRSRLVPPKIFAVAGGALAAVLAAGSAVFFTDGLPGRFASAGQSVAPASEWDSQAGVWLPCFIRADNRYHFPRADDACVLGDLSQDPSFLLWGDSHADALSAGLNASAERNAVAGKVIGGAGCPALLDINFTPMEYCLKHNRRILRYISSHPELKTIILAGRWALYTTGNPFKTEEVVPFSLSDFDAGEERAYSNADLFRVGLNRTVEALLAMDREVVIVASIPEVGYLVPASYSIALRTGRDIHDMIAPTRAEYIDRNTFVLPVLAQIQEEHAGVRVLDPLAELCDGERCMVIFEHTPLYRDDDHLSTFGAIHISTLFDPLFAAPVK